MNKKLARIGSEKKIAGICAGLARHFGMNVSMVRIIYVLLTLLTGSLLFWLYIILWLVVSQE